MPIATITFTFDPLLHLTEALVVRWMTVGLAAALAAALVAAGVAARRGGLRTDDLLYIAIGAVPGAVVGGRIGYALAHAGTFGGDPWRLIDPAVAGADLGLAVVGGTLTATYVVSLLGAPLGHWAHTLALPLLLAIGTGKLAMVLGGSGQGVLSDAAWATAYLGPGPWGSLAPELPAHPAQAYEGFATLGWVVVLAVVAASGVFAARDGRLFLVAVAGWAAIRALVSLVWRDPVAIGPFGVAGAMAVVIAVAALVGVIVLTARARRRPSSESGASTGGPGTGEPSWPDPEARPRF